MPIYEVDVRKRSWDFYHLEANSRREAEELLDKALNTGNMDGITFARTVTHDPVVATAIHQKVITFLITERGYLNLTLEEIKDEH